MSIRYFLLGTAVLGLAACGSSGSSTGPPGGPPPVALLQVTVPLPIELREGEGLTLTVRAVDGRGQPVAGAAAHIRATSSDPSVLAPAGGPGSIVPAQASGEATFSFVAVGAGTAEIVISYPCAPATAGCTPDHTVAVPVTVEPTVAGFDIQPPAGGTLEVGGSRTLTVQAVTADGTPVPGPDLAITAESLSPAVLGVEVSVGVPGDGAIDLTLRGLSPGAAVLRLRHPDVSAAFDFLVLVVARASQVVASPSMAALVPGDRLIITIQALDAGGNPVPNAELGFDVVSSDPTVVAVVDVTDPTPGDGSARVTVEARQLGQADVIVRYPGVPDAVVRISVQEVVAGPPTDRLPGGYIRTGTLLEDTCGGAPTTIGNPPGSIVQVTRSNDDVTMIVGLETYSGSYDPTTGAWEASAVVPEGGETVRKTHVGNWRESEGNVVFRGTLTIEPLNPDGSVRCATRYDVEYERL